MTPESKWISRRILVEDSTYDVYGWLDNAHVLAYSTIHPGLQSIDVNTADRTRVVRMVDPQHGNVWPTLATDLVGRPFVPGVAPPSPGDPRTLPEIGLGIVSFGLLGMLMWIVLRWENRRALRSLATE